MRATEAGKADSGPRGGKLRRAAWLSAGFVACVGLCLWIVRTPGPEPKSLLPDMPDLAGKNEAFKKLLREVDREARAVGSAAAVGKLADVYHANLFYTQAALCYPLAAELEPDNPRWPYLHAAALQSLGISDGVAELLRRTLALDGQNVLALLRLAELELKLERNDEARASYQRVLALTPNNPFAYLGLARWAMAVQDWPEARRLLERTVKIDPHFGTAYRLLTGVYEQMGEKELAVKTTATANVRGRIREVPDPWISELEDLCCDVHYLLTMEVTRVSSPLRGGPWRLDLLRRLAQYAPDNAEVHLYLGQALMQRNNMAEAGVHLREAVRLDPKHEDAWCILGAWLAMNGRHAESEEQLLAAMKVNPQSYRAALMLGMLRLEQGRAEEATDFLRRGLGHDAVLPLQTIKLYIETLRRLGRTEDAFKFVRELIVLRPTTGSFWVCLADLAVQQKDWEQAEQVLREGLAAAPYNAIIADRLAWLLATSPRATQASGEEAIRWAQVAVDTGDPNDPSGHPAISLAAAYARVGRYDEAVATAQQAMAVVRSSGDQAAMRELAEHLHRYNARQPFTTP